MSKQVSLRGAGRVDGGQRGGGVGDGRRLSVSLINAQK